MEPKRSLEEVTGWVRAQIEAGRTNRNIVRQLYQKGFEDAEIVQLGQRVGRTFDPSQASRTKREIPPLTKTRVLRSAAGGALLIGGLGIARLSIYATESLAEMGGPVGYVTLCIVLGGVWGAIFAVTTPWRYAGGLRRWTAYGAMGGAGGIIILGILAAGGLMAGASLGDWVGTLIITVGICAVSLNISRWFYEKLGVWSD